MFPQKNMITLKTPAKINWTLAVLDKRPDGYHNIQSLMQTVSLCDELSFTECDRLKIVSTLHIPVEQNLVFKAAQALRSATSCSLGAAITLSKEIPEGAGLGGGSSNAAGTLLGLNSLWSLGLSNAELADIGAKVGADVPFYFAAPVARVEGRGDVVAPLRMTQGFTLLLVYPSFGVSTAWAYSELADRRSLNLTKSPDNLDNIKLLLDILEKKDFSGIQLCLRNDLEAVAAERYPVISAIRQQMIEVGAVAASMSGSGSTVFGLFADREQAVRASHSFPGSWTRVVRTLTVADGSR